MIICDIKNDTSLYADKRISVVCETLERLLKDKPLPGHYQIDGEDFYYNVMAYEAEPAENKKFENHRKYIDIHATLDGEEYTDVTDMSCLVRTAEYSDEKDCEFFDCNGKYTSVYLTHGKLLYVAPGEYHRPGVMTSKNGNTVLKAVFKLAVK